MNDAPAPIQFALISHTNAGKTTLARTLVGMDVGEVRDAPHVTTLSEAHTLLSTPEGDALQLWDTPGFGDSVRLYKRLALSGNPIGWFLREVIDRYRDRPLWLSQQAMRTARDAADVVLYLVNSAEDPKDAGYLAPEMKILQWLDKPVVVLLNQMGSPRPFAEEGAEQKRWETWLADYPVVRKVLPLDAFARCWVHERVFYEAVGELLPAAKKESYARLFQAWEQGNEARFQASMQVIAGQLAAAAADSEPIAPEERAALGAVFKAIGMGKQREAKRADKALQALAARLNEGTAAATARLLEQYRLDAGAAAVINERVSQGFVVHAPVDAKQAGLLGALVSGAATGLSVDLMHGGLTFGAGALLGALAGALTFSSAAWAFNASTDRNEPRIMFSDEFLRTLVVAALLRYLAVAHFGRGRGNFVEGEAPAFWQKEVEAAVAQHGQALAAAWQAARADGRQAEARALLAAALTRMAAQVLERLYPRPAIAAR